MSLPNLILDEPPLIVQPSLVRLLGDHESAAFLQQVHYRARRGQAADGHKWAVATTAEWCDDAVLGAAQFKRVVKHLTELGVLISSQPGQYDRTSWRRVDYEKLEALMAAKSHRSETARCAEQVETAASNGEQIAPSIGRESADVPTREVEELEEKPSVEPSADAPLTENQIAKLICDGYWLWYAERHEGKQPVLSFMAFRAVVVKALKAGHGRRAIQDALKAMHDRGIGISYQSIDRQLTRPGARNTSPGVLEQLGALEFDAAGNLKG